MARLPRYFVKGQAQYIIQRDNNREHIFVDEQWYLEKPQSRVVASKTSERAHWSVLGECVHCVTGFCCFINWLAMARLLRAFL